MACSSNPRPSLVTKLEPTLTTMRRASRKIVLLSVVMSKVFGVTKTVGGFHLPKG
jgi:hypothetical protein